MSNTELDLEQEIFAFGKELYAQVQDSGDPLFDYNAKLLDWAMKDEEVKVSMFRFIDVLPTLEDSPSVIRYVQEYFEPISTKIPDFLTRGLRINPQSIASKIAARVIKHQVKSIAHRFILGETPTLALKKLREIRRNKLAFTVDLLGEASVSEFEALIYRDRYLELLSCLAENLPTWPESAAIIPKHRGEKTQINISVKLSALYSQAKAIDFDNSVSVLSERLYPIFSKAKEVGGFVYLDMEDSSYTSLTLETFKRLLSSDEFKHFTNAGIVLQAYLRRTEEDLNQLLSWTKQRDIPIAIRLVKGAYWDTETILATQRDWPIPVWQEKQSSDANFERLSLILLKNTPIIMPAFGSHNIRSLSYAICTAKALGVSLNNFEIQMLYGMAEPIKKVFIQQGFLVRDYAPIGELIPGMGYLVRRLLENTSNEGFLRKSFREHETAEVLLKKPIIVPGDTGTEHLNQDPKKHFQNTPLRDFSVETNRNNLTQEIKALKKKTTSNPEIVKPIIGGEVISSQTVIDCSTVEDPSHILSQTHYAEESLIDQAFRQLQEFFPKWRDTSVDMRADILFRAAVIIDQQREALSAIIILESGKPWIEADADVCEAIDFLRYYAHEAIRLSRTQILGNYPGEQNSYFYEPRGIALVISPWNFPLAIPCGMFAAALVTGNCCILKPAEQSSLIAQRLFEIFLNAGLPKEAACFLPGLGETIGALLVRDPRISTIAFTGSKSVGLNIVRTAADTGPKNEHVKRVIVEMGGKNAIIVDEAADLDEAIKGVVYSAFGNQGQKCSACSRVIVLKQVYDKFTHRLREAVKSIQIGPASSPANLLGPLIDQEAFQRLNRFIDQWRTECSVLVEAPAPFAGTIPSHYVSPIVFTDIPKDHPLLFTELFGPVIALQKADDFDQALELANHSEYALTGAVFSRSPKNIKSATRSFRVGNLYINRPSTGALVMRQPFGGAKMSGVGSKAGGPDYLLQFLIPRTVSENTLRRGFAPEL